MTPAEELPDLPPGPFVYVRRVRWGECDPAKIAYTGNIPGMALEAVEDWVKACTGADWYVGHLDQGIGTPFVHLSCDFTAPITPRHDLVCHLTVERLGRASVATRVEALQDGRLCLKARYVFACVDAESMKPIPIPPAIRARMRRFAEAQGRDFEDAAGG